MADARCRDQWTHTSLVCAVLVNSNPFRKGKPAEPDAFMPKAYRPPKKPRQRLMVGIDVITAIFVPEARAHL